MERLNLETLAKQKGVLENELATARERARAVEAEFDAFRDRQRNSPEAALRDKISQLELEKADLVRPPRFWLFNATRVSVLASEMVDGGVGVCVM